jgi:glycolate oxidase iron-sulfur subunit
MTRIGYRLSLLHEAAQPVTNNILSDNDPTALGACLPKQVSLLAQRTIEEADRCVLCGLCLPHCPTYRQTGDENESPRGRVSLMRAMASGALPASDQLAAHLSRCLACRACERVCPSGVHYGQLIDAGRELLQTQRPITWLTRIGLGLVARPQLLEILSTFLRLYQRSGLQRLVRASPVLRWLRLERMESLLPNLPRHLSKQTFYPAHGQRRGRVALFLGCVARVVDADTLAAAIRLLTGFGFEVVIPDDQTCCGALQREAGRSVQAQVLAHANLNAFQKAEVDTVITVASGCGAVLADSASNLDTGTAHSTGFIDIHQFLADVALPESMTLAPLPHTIAVQDPCSLRNVLRAEQAVYALLGRIPAARIVPLAENHLCCGGAGAYPLRQPAMAALLRADKIAHLQQLQPSVLATANLGCALHLNAGLRAQGLAIEVAHPLVLFERQLREKTAS